LDVASLLSGMDASLERVKSPGLVLEESEEPFATTDAMTH
jgi:hypothetical protein